MSQYDHHIDIADLALREEVWAAEQARVQEYQVKMQEAWDAGQSEVWDLFADSLAATMTPRNELGDLDRNEFPKRLDEVRVAWGLTPLAELKLTDFERARTQKSEQK